MIKTINKTRFVRCIAPTGDPLSVTPGQYYQVLADPAESEGMLRIVDNTGEDYLYAAELFEELADLTGIKAELSIGLTIPMKAALHQAASQRGVSMAALLREWIDERLDLPMNG